MKGAVEAAIEAGEEEAVDLVEEVEGTASAHVAEGAVTASVLAAEGVVMASVLVAEAGVTASAQGAEEVVVDLETEVVDVVALEIGEEAEEDAVAVEEEVVVEGVSKAGKRSLWNLTVSLGCSLPEVKRMPLSL